MDELEERAEIDRLAEEQLRDDTYQVAPEFREMVPFDEGLNNCVSKGEGGEIEWYDNRSLGRVHRGSVLVGTASWHGSFGGYTNHKCRCAPCSKAASEHLKAYRRAKKAA